MISFTVPLIPPSANHYVKHTRKGKHYVTAKAKAFKEAVAIFGKDAHLSHKRYQVDIHLYLPKGMRGDIDNFAKVTLDSLVSAGIIDSDAGIEALHMHKFRDPNNPRTEITVRACPVTAKSITERGVSVNQVCN